MSDSNFPILPEVQTSLSRDDKDFQKLSTSSSWLARLQLAQASSDMVKQGKVASGGNWAYIADKDNPEDLGKQTPVVVLNWRPKALHFNGNKLIASSYDMKDPVFSEIVAGAEVQKQGDDDSYMYGPEFLLWAPRAKSGIGAFCTFFCSSKTNRRAAPDVRAMLGHPAVLSSKFIKTVKFSWFGFTVAPLTEKLTAVPEPEALQQVIQQFLNPPKEDKELAKQAELDR